MARKNGTTPNAESGSTSKPIGADDSSSATVTGNDAANSGLPSANGSSSDPVNPETAEREPESAAAIRTRARARSGNNNSKSGSSAAATGKNKRVSPEKAQETLTILLHGIHNMLGAIAQTPELQISKEESAQIADALARVQAEFDVAIISPKAAAISNLGMTMAGIYVPRFIGMRARVAGEKAAARKTQQQPQLISTERKQ